MDVQITRSNDIYLFDPQINGYTSLDLFKTITGTPAISGTKLRMTSAEIYSLNYFRNGSLDMAINIPTAPATSDVRSFGLKSQVNNGRFEFDITDDVFSAKVYDAEGTIVATKTIPWDTAWSATEVRYRISCSERNVFFAIGEVIVARFQDYHDITPDIVMPNSPLPIHIKNGNADNMDVGIVSFA